MKKFISMVMAAAMVVSLVPATAFAANAATFKVVGDKEYTDETVIEGDELKVGEVQVKVTDVDTKVATDDFDFELTFDNAEFVVVDEDGKDATVVAEKDEEGNLTVALTDIATLYTNDSKDGTDGVKTFPVYLAADIDNEDTSVKLNLVEDAFNLEEGDVLVFDIKTLQEDLAELGAVLKITDDADVTVEVDSDFGTSDAMTLIALLEEGIKVTLKKVGEVAEEESKKLEAKLTIETLVGTFQKDQIIEIKLNSGFEFEGTPGCPAELDYLADESDDDVAVYKVLEAGHGKDEIVFSREMLVIDAVDAKAGDVAKLTVKVKEGEAKEGFKDSVTVDAMEVVGETVTISVEEDEDVPVMYSGVAPETKSINVEEDDFISLEVTIKESVPGALDVKKDLELMLPEGVFVTNVDVTKATAVEVAVADKTMPAKDLNDAEKAFAVAYEEGKHAGFVFDRKTFTDTTDVKDGKDAMELKFKLELMAVPGFEGDVVLTMDGPAFEEAQEVVIAKFVSPYKVEAAQNDLIIDYRNTEVPTDIVVTEAEAGLWADGASALRFSFEIDHMTFEDDAVITVNEASEMEVEENGKLGFYVDEESDEEAAVVTISNISLYMNRSLPAGAYDLEMGTNAGYVMMAKTKLFTTEDEGAFGKAGYYAADVANWDTTTEKDDNGVKSTVFERELGVAKEAFINVVTAGRDQDDASFTKKVVVTIGADTLVAGEDTVALDVPAYINAAGYTMLPVRAVAVALGIHNNNVIWDQATKTVTILYGQRIITMQAGSKVINVNGSAIPASAAVEIVNGRTFLGLRDLATALGVVDITWDGATQTATLNGNK